MKTFLKLLSIMLLAYVFTACGSDSTNTTLKPATGMQSSPGGLSGTTNPLPKGVVVSINLINGVNCEFEVRDINTNKISKYSGACSTFEIGDSLGLGAFGNGSVRPDLKSLK